MGENLVRPVCGFYYGQLSIDEQMIYKKVGRAAAGLEEKVTPGDMEAMHVGRICTAIRYDNPEFFYWQTEEQDISGGELIFSYRIKDRAEIREKLEAIRNRLEEILQTLQKEGDTAESILKGVYTYLAEHVTYAEEELQRPNLYPWIYDMEGVFLHGRAVCLGLARAMQYVCNYLHLPSVLVTGDAVFGGAKVNHGWNLVRTAAGYRHLDVTYAVCDPQNAKDYYLMTDETASGVRTWKKDLYPEAGGGA